MKSNQNEEIERIKYSLNIIGLLKENPNEKLYMGAIEMADEITDESFSEGKKIEERIAILDRKIERHDKDIKEKLDEIILEIEKTKGFVQKRCLWIAEEIHELNEQQLKDFENIIEQELDQVRDINVKHKLESHWHRAKEAASVSADFITLISTAISIFNIVSGSTDTASTILTLQNIISKIRKY